MTTHGMVIRSFQGHMTTLIVHMSSMVSPKTSTTRLTTIIITPMIHSHRIIILKSALICLFIMIIIIIIMISMGMISKPIIRIIQPIIRTTIHKKMKASWRKMTIKRKKELMDRIQQRKSMKRRITVVFVSKTCYVSKALTGLKGWMTLARVSIPTPIIWVRRIVELLIFGIWLSLSVFQ